jgi:phage baseplate assembly protein gpV
MKIFLIILAVVLLLSFGNTALAAAPAPDDTSASYTATPESATASQQVLREPTGAVTTASPALPRGTVNDDTVKLVLVIAAAAAVAVMLIFYKRNKNGDQ